MDRIFLDSKDPIEQDVDVEWLHLSVIGVAETLGSNYGINNVVFI